MNRSVTMILAAALAAAAFGCTQFGGVATLRGADTAAADKAPAEQLAYTGKKPGLQKPIARTFSTQPPLVPHAVDNFDEITVESNQCVECHGIDSYQKKNAPKLGDSHRVGVRCLVAPLRGKPRRRRHKRCIRHA
jgi:cytochrome c-type protein NapB